MNTHPLAQHTHSAWTILDESDSTGTDSDQDAVSEDEVKDSIDDPLWTLLDRWLQQDPGCLDRLDNLFREMEGEGFEINEDFDEDAVFSAISGFFDDEDKKPEFVPKPLDGFRVPKGHKTYKEIETSQILDGNTFDIFTTEDENDRFKDKVLAGADGKAVQVGVCKKGLKLSLRRERGDWLAVAGKLGEEASPKGTCVSFSTLAHSAAICLLVGLADKGKRHEYKEIEKLGLYEVLEGYDAIVDGFSVEVTGAGYRTRSSGADVCFSKYQILRVFQLANSDSKVILRLSVAEDQKDSSALMGTPVDQGGSPYRDACVTLASLTRGLRDVQKDAIVKQFASWVSRQEIPKFPKSDRVYNGKSIMETIRKGCKEIDSRPYLPSPVRVLPLPEDDEKHVGSGTVWPRVTQGGTTYHTIPFESDLKGLVLRRESDRLEPPINGQDTLSLVVFEMLSPYSLFRSIYSESVLMSKVCSKSGDSYNRKISTGISWRQVRSGASTYYGCYYQIGHIQEAYSGTWELVDRDKSLWRSPTFKFSQRDINYSVALPGKLLALAVSALTRARFMQWKQIIEHLMSVFAWCHLSSWETSSLMKNCRSLTVNWMTGGGDIPKIFQGLSMPRPKSLTFGNAYYLSLAHSASLRYNGTAQATTPLLSLPPSLMYLEQNCALLTMWHIRGLHHGSDAWLKIKKSMEEELAERELQLGSFRSQIDFLRLCSSSGATQDDFDNMMLSSYDTPHWNQVVCIALTRASNFTKRIGETQAPTRSSLRNLMSERSQCVTTSSRAQEGIVVSTSRAAEQLINCCSKYDDPQSIFHLVARVLQGEPVSVVFAHFAKDAKQKDRAIAMMTATFRQLQLLSESATSHFNLELDTDQMMNPDKFCDYGNHFMDVFRKRGSSCSKDKTAFNSGLNPSFMSLGALCAAIETGAAPLVMSAQIMMANSSRWLVSIPGMKEYSKKNEIELFPEGVETISCHVKRGKKNIDETAGKVYRCMGEGVFGNAGGMLNAIATQGAQEVASMIVEPGVKPEDRVVVKDYMTTSDDSIESVIAHDHKEYSHDSIADYYFRLSSWINRFMSMKDGVDSITVSRRRAEFNNEIVTINGIVPQESISAFLNVNALVGSNIASDLITVSKSCQSVFKWGGSLDAGRAVYDSMISILCQKWLFTYDELSDLQIFGMLPHDDNTIFNHDIPKDRRLVGALLDLMTEHQIESVKEGRISLLQGLCQFKAGRDPKRHKVKRMPICNSSIVSVGETAKQMHASRIIGQRLKPQFVRNMPLLDRIAAKNSFMKAIRSEEIKTPGEVIDVVMAVLPQANIRLGVRNRKRSDFEPCKLGAMVSVVDKPDFKCLDAARYCGIRLASEIPEKFRHLLQLTDDEYEKYKRLQINRDSMFGYTAYCPRGLPTARRVNGVLYTRPQTLTVSTMDVPPVKSSAYPNVGGRAYQNYKSAVYSSDVLNYLRNRSMRPAIGSSVDKSVTVFYCELGKRMKAGSVTREDDNFYYVKDRNSVFACPKRLPSTVLDPRDFGVPYDKIEMSYIDGTRVTHINYGAWVNTRERAACEIMSRVFEALGSGYPPSMNRFKPNWPLWHPSAIEVEYGYTAKLIGEKFTPLLKLKQSAMSKEIVYVDVTNQNLKLVTGDLDEELYW